MTPPKLNFGGHAVLVSVKGLCIRRRGHTCTISTSVELEHVLLAALACACANWDLGPGTKDYSQKFRCLWQLHALFSIGVQGGGGGGGVLRATLQVKRSVSGGCLYRISVPGVSMPLPFEISLTFCIVQTHP